MVKHFLRGDVNTPLGQRIQDFKVRKFLKTMLKLSLRGDVNIIKSAASRMANSQFKVWKGYQSNAQTLSLRGEVSSVSVQASQTDYSGFPSLEGLSSVFSQAPSQHCQDSDLSDSNFKVS